MLSRLYRMHHSQSVITDQEYANWTSTGFSCSSALIISLNLLLDINYRATFPHRQSPSALIRQEHAASTSPLLLYISIQNYYSSTPRTRNWCISVDFLCTKKQTAFYSTAGDQALCTSVNVHLSLKKLPTAKAAKVIFANANK